MRTDDDDDDDNTRRKGSFKEDSFVLVRQSLTGERTTKVEGTRQRRGSVKEDSFNNHLLDATWKSSLLILA